MGRPAEEGTVAADDEWRGKLAAEVKARRAADELAVALEEVGFDVGVAFPSLTSSVTRDDRPVVDLGAVSDVTASQLADVLTNAVRHGVTVIG
jgi:hypothetical protein